jgi:hypothetical protein
VYTPHVARQRHGENVTAAMNTPKELLEASFSMRSMYQRKVGHEFFPELIVNLYWLGKPSIVSDGLRAEWSIHDMSRIFFCLNLCVQTSYGAHPAGTGVSSLANSNQGQHSAQSYDELNAELSCVCPLPNDGLKLWYISPNEPMAMNHKGHGWKRLLSNLRRYPGICVK